MLSYKWKINPSNAFLIPTNVSDDSFANASFFFFLLFPHLFKDLKIFPCLFIQCLLSSKIFRSFSTSIFFLFIFYPFFFQQLFSIMSFSHSHFSLFFSLFISIFLLRFSLFFCIVCFFFSSLISKSFFLSFLLFQSCFSAWRLSLIRAANAVSIFIFRYVWPPATIALREREKRGKNHNSIRHGSETVMSQTEGVFSSLSLSWRAVSSVTENRSWSSECANYESEMAVGGLHKCCGPFHYRGKLIQWEVPENGSVCEVGVSDSAIMNYQVWKNL